MTQKARKTVQADGVGLYLDEVSEHQLLTAEDEVRLARAMEAGRHAAARLETERLPSEERFELRRLINEGEEARAQFIRSNLRLVISIAKKYTGRGQEGYWTYILALLYCCSLQLKIVRMTLAYPRMGAKEPTNDKTNFTR